MTVIRECREKYARIDNQLRYIISTKKEKHTDNNSRHKLRNLNQVDRCSISRNISNPVILFRGEKQP